MRAVRVHAYGEPPRIDDLSSPVAPDREQLSVEVSAAGVGSWDVGVASGRLARFVGLERAQVQGRCEAVQEG